MLYCIVAVLVYMLALERTFDIFVVVVSWVNSCVCVLLGHRVCFTALLLRVRVRVRVCVCVPYRTL